MYNCVVHNHSVERLMCVRWSFWEVLCVEEGTLACLMWTRNHGYYQIGVLESISSI